MGKLFIFSNGVSDICVLIGHPLGDPSGGPGYILANFADFYFSQKSCFLSTLLSVYLFICTYILKMHSMARSSCPHRTKPIRHAPALGLSWCKLQQILRIRRAAAFDADVRRLEFCLFAGCCKLLLSKQLV